MLVGCTGRGLDPSRGSHDFSSRSASDLSTRHEDLLATDLRAGQSDLLTVDLAARDLLVADLTVEVHPDLHALPHDLAPPPDMAVADLSVATAPDAGGTVSPPAIEYVKKIPGSEYARTINVAFASDGSLYATGIFDFNASSSIDFGLGPLTCAGEPKGYLVRLSSSGEVLWQRCLGNVGNGYLNNTSLYSFGPFGIAATTDGGVAIAGSYAGTIDFGAGGVTAGPTSQTFIAVYAGDGTLRFTRLFSFDTSSYCLGLASSGTGHLAVNALAFSADSFFVQQVDENGNDEWTYQTSSVSNEGWASGAVQYAASGDVVFAGMYYGTFETPDGAITSLGGDDLFVTRLHADGTHQWTRSIGGTSGDRFGGLAVAVDGSTYVSETAYYDFDGGLGTTTLPGVISAVLVKFDPSGLPLWQRLPTSSGYTTGGPLAVTSSGDPVWSGYLEETTADFGLGAIGGSLGSAPSYLASYRADGSIRFASIPSSGGVAQEPQSLAIGPDGQLALAGYFNGTTAFGAVSLTSHSCAYIGCDAFVQVFSP